jgi:hypothetical protein
MDPRHLTVDQRLLGACVFCGRKPDSRDHVPSKVFLDDPLPENLPVVEACTACNQSFSLDEEYLACLLEAVASGTSDPDEMRRTKISDALRRNVCLRQRLHKSMVVEEDGSLIWTPEQSRVRNVVLKLARGHAAYELSLPQLDEPRAVAFAPLISLTDEARAEFERAGAGEVRGWPEVGSRALLRAVRARPFEDTEGPWIEVQAGRYRYSVDQAGGVIVRIVLAEYLACEVGWA